MFAVETPTLFVAFYSGIFTFLSPCIFPLIPAYLSFMSGESLENLKTGQSSSKLSPRLKAFIGAVFFGIGFSIVFVALGASASSLGHFFYNNKSLLATIGGVIIIIFGLYMVGILKKPFLTKVFGPFFNNKEKQENKPSFIDKIMPAFISNNILKMKTALNNFRMYLRQNSVPFYLNAFLLGLIFVFGMSSCTGPILGAILIMASNEASVYQSMWLLFVYSLGLWVPFLISALAINELMVFMKKANKFVFWVEKISGILLILLGIILVTDKMEILVNWLSSFFSFLPVVG